MTLKSSDTRRQAIEQLKSDDDIALEMLQILLAFEEGQKVGTPKDKNSKVEEHQNMETDRDFLFESFRQLRTAYRTSMVMSVVMFVIGVAFLAITAVRSFADPTSVTVTSVIGGIGVVQIVALFCRNPLCRILPRQSSTHSKLKWPLSHIW